MDASRHRNITLLTFSEVEWVEREGGEFQVRIRKKARSVDVDKCTGCGACIENCIVRNAPYLENLQIAEVKE
jgi:heterodisulfide reductase subunit A